MRLLRLQIRKLYGTLDKDVSFNPDLNLLVGINGSGKTSVLNVIDWLLRADIPRLATTLFQRLTLRFAYADKELILEAVQSARDLNVYLKGTDSELHPFNVILKQAPATISVSDLEGLYEDYSRLGPEEKERPIFEAIKSLPKPIVIALDRTISAEIDERVYTETDSRFSRNLRARTTRSPLGQVIQLTSQRYGEYRSTADALNEVLKAKMVLSALRDPGDPSRPARQPRITPNDIENLERKVVEFVSSAIKDPGVVDQTKKFFRRFRSLPARQLSPKRTNQDLLWLMFAGQFQQVADLASAFKEFEEKTTAAYAGLSRYLNVVNTFLRDGKKQIVFNEKTSQLAFRFLSENGEPHGELRDIHHLSSGERQVLILFTFLAFVEDERRVFIVDEPELSLHPKWQSEFLHAFLSLKPRDTQVLLATHSPEIVGTHKEACVVLLPQG